MAPEVLNLIVTIAGAIIITLISAIAYFLKILHTDTKKAIEEVGKNKGRIELVELQLNSDVKRLEQTTQLELRNLAETVGKLSASVDQLVKVQLNLVTKA